MFWKRMKFQKKTKFSMYPDFMTNLSLVKSNVSILWLLNIQDANFHPVVPSFLEVTYYGSFDPIVAQGGGFSLRKIL